MIGRFLVEDRDTQQPSHNPLAQLDERLRSLALEAQNSPPGSRQRRRALTRLVQLTRTSGRLCHPYTGQFPHVYDDIYNEALQMLFVYICDRIDAYNPKRSPFLRWVNFLLQRRFFNEAIPRIIGDRREISSNSLTPSVQVQQQVSTRGLSPSLSEAIGQCLRDDPGGLFERRTLRQKPEVTFKIIAIRRLNGESWKSISADLGVRISTLSDFYQRSLSEFSKFIKDYVQT
jgi:hypothetical protein